MFFNRFIPISILACSCFLFLLISCKKKEDDSMPESQPDRGFVYTDSFYKNPRKVLFREDFNSSSAWSFNSFSSLHSTGCGTDTSIAMVSNGQLVLIPKSRDLKGEGYLGSIYAQGAFPAIKYEKDVVYGMELTFDTYVHEKVSGVLRPSSTFFVHFDSLELSPLFTEEASMRLNNGSINICFRNDTILGIIDLPKRELPYFVNNNGRVYFELKKTQSSLNAIRFSSTFVNAGPSGCIGQNCIVESIEIFEILH